EQGVARTSDPCPADGLSLKAFTQPPDMEISRVGSSSQGDAYQPAGARAAQQRGSRVFTGGMMSLRIRSIVGSAAVAGLVIAGTVAASATDPVTIEKVGYFEVQGDSKVAGANNVEPEAWFSEHD